MVNLEDKVHDIEAKAFEKFNRNSDKASALKGATTQKREKHSAERSMIERYMKNNYTKVNLALGEVAEAFGYEYGYFSKYFLKFIGKPFRRYLNDLRLEAARELILSTDFKCYEISKMVGYSNYEHFARLYNKKFGKSPNEIRRGV